MQLGVLSPPGVDRTEPPAELHEVLGGYRLESIIGQGGMGTVYRARHRLLGRVAAIKVLSGDLTHNMQYVSRFFAEAKIVNDVQHPNIVDVTDFIDQPQPRRVAFVMELLDGEPLSVVLKRGPLSLTQSVNVCRQLSDALVAVHARGVIHRDLKPENIIVIGDLDTVPSVKILDFGIAKVTEGVSMHQTATGTTMGTPAYMAPEQISAAPVSNATDVYALGEILYELVTGQRVFRGDNITMFQQKLSSSPPTLTFDESVTDPTTLTALISACVSLRPQARPTLDQFRATVEAIQLDPGEATTTRALAPTRTSSIESLRPLQSSSVSFVAHRPIPMALWAAAALVMGVVIAMLTFKLTASPSVVSMEVEPPANAIELAVRPAPAVASIAVDSEPSGAAVYDIATNRALGVTPLQVAVVDGATRAVELRHTGYQAEAVVLDSVVPVAPIELTPLPSERVTKTRRRTKRRRTRTERLAPESTPTPVSSPGDDADDSALKKKEMPTW